MLIYTKIKIFIWKNNKIILFDGVCNLCNSSVNFIIDHDKNGLFKFASLQSEAGQSILNKYGLKQKDFDSIVLVENDKLFHKINSRAKDHKIP